MNTALTLAKWIDAFNERIGRLVSYLVLGVVLITFAVAVLRYGFSLGWVWMQELADWLHAMVFMLAVGYTLLHDAHARVDVFYRPADIRTKAIINLIGSVLFIFPSIGLLLYYSIPYAIRSWERLETSKEAGGLPGLFVLKTAVAVFCLLLILQAISMAIHNLARLLNGDSSLETPPSDQEETIDGI